MVSKARLDFPDPDSPVRTIRRSRGSSRPMSLRLCSRAPRMTILSATAGPAYRERQGANTCSTVALGAGGRWPSRGPRPRVPAPGGRPRRRRTVVTALAREVSLSGSGGVPQLPLEVLDLVPQPGGVLEAQLGGGLVHLLLQGLDEPGQLGRRQLGQVGV